MCVCVCVHVCVCVWIWVLCGGVNWGKSHTSLLTPPTHIQLLEWIHQTLPWLNDRSGETTLDAAQHRLEEFRQYATGTKPPKVEEKGRLEMHFHTLQTKLRLSSRPAYVPSEGKLVNVRRGRGCRGLCVLWGGGGGGERERERGGEVYPPKCSAVTHTHTVRMFLGHQCSMEGVGRGREDIPGVPSV